MPRPNRSASSNTGSSGSNSDGQVNNSQGNSYQNQHLHTQQPLPQSSRYIHQPALHQPVGRPNVAKIESIKNYYYQLSNSLRNVTAQLQQHDLTPGRRQALGLQQEKLQSSLTEFTEKVLRPLMTAARSGTPPAHIDSGFSVVGIQQFGGQSQFPAINQPLTHSQQQTMKRPSNVLQQPTQPKSNKHLLLLNQHYQESQQQQTAFQQRLQARASVAAATSAYHVSAITRPHSPFPHQRMPSASPAMPQLSRATSMQRLLLNSPMGGELRNNITGSLSSAIASPSGGNMSMQDMDLSTMPTDEDDVHKKEKPRKRLADVRPDLDKATMNQILINLDEVVERIAMQSVEYALHSGNNALSARDVAMAVEDVLGPEWRLPRWAFAVQPQTVVKRPTLANTTHSARLAQIRKDCVKKSQ